MRSLILYLAPLLVSVYAAPAATTCSPTAAPTVPAGINCGITGSLASPAPLSLAGSQSNTLDTCAASCLAAAKCASFGFNSNTTTCSLYTKNLNFMGYNPRKTASLFYNRKCFVCASGTAPTSTTSTASTPAPTCPTITDSPPAYYISTDYSAEDWPQVTYSYVSSGANYTVQFSNTDPDRLPVKNYYAGNTTLATAIQKCSDYTVQIVAPYNQFDSWVLSYELKQQQWLCTSYSPAHSDGVDTTVVDANACMTYYYSVDEEDEPDKK